jgi:hypothetical protein
MSKRSPFDWVKSINEKKYIFDLSGYVPFLTNRCFAMHMDTIMLAEEMNQAHRLGPELQYDFYYYAVRKGKRFGFPPKVQDDSNTTMIMEYYQYSRVKAQQALQLLTPEQIKQIKQKLDRGGM